MSTSKHKQIGKKKIWVNTEVKFQWNEFSQAYEQVQARGYWYDGPLALATTPPTMEVTNWAFYNDGTESGATIIGTVNTNPTLDVDTIYQVRFGLEETSGNASKNEAPQLQYNHNGGGFNNVTGASSVVQATATANIADGADTTQRITAFTFDSSNEGFDEVDGIAGGSTTDLNNNGFEALFSFQILSGDVADTDTIVLKIVDSAVGDSDYDVYNQTDPTITVNEAAASLSASESESITIADARTMVSVSGITAAEAISVADAPTINIFTPGPLSIDEAETISVTDSPEMGMDWSVSAAETITVADVPTSGLYTGVTVAVIIGVSDVATIVSEGEVSAAESIAVVDSPTVSVSGGNITASVAEALSVSDVVTVVSDSGITANESITIADSPAIESEFTASAEEVIGIVLSATAVSDAGWTAAESFSVSDVPLINIPGGGISASVSESITVSDSPTFTSDMELSATESISVIDSPTASIASPGGSISVDEAESITLTDATYDLFPDKTHSAIIAQLNRIERIVKFNRTLLLGG